MAQQLDRTAAISTTYETYAQIFKALADPKRLELLELIGRKKSVCVCDLVDEMEMPQSKLSYHLKILLTAGLVSKETKGTWSYYALASAEIEKMLPNDLAHMISSQ